MPTTDPFVYPGDPTVHRAHSDVVLLAHGGGGQLSDQLLRETVLPRLGNEVLNALMDSAILASLEGDRPVLTIDSYVVQPWHFPGGDIGRLAVSGTVNDLAMCGAQPVGLALGMILAEGLRRSVLEQVLDSIARAAEQAGVPIVTGDTKVVGRGQADGIYLTSAGIGRVPAGCNLSAARAQPGDALLINGPIADHGLAVMLAREMPTVESVITSDVAPLNGLVKELLQAVGEDLVFLRDPTRGGLAGVVSDLALQCGWNVELDEAAIPVRAATRHAAEMLGLDPLEVANEGKLVAVVRPRAAQQALRVLADHPLGRQAARIGTVIETKDSLCVVRTDIGGHRVLQKPYGEQLPRIC